MWLQLLLWATPCLQLGATLNVPLHRVTYHGELATEANELLLCDTERCRFPTGQMVPAPFVLSADEISASTVAGLHNLLNILYYTDAVAVGSPAVYPRLVVDTGSSDLVIKAGKVGEPGRERHFSANSTATTARIALRFLEGSLVGAEVQDKVCVGELCVAHQDLVLASPGTVTWFGALLDGILGLAFPLVAKDRHGPTFLASLMKAGFFKNFGFSLNLAVSLGERGGLLTFGELPDLHREAGNITGAIGVELPLLPLGSKGYAFWMVRMTSLHIGEPMVGIFDSGTSLIGLPPTLFVLFALSLIAENPGTCTIVYGMILCLCDPVAKVELSFAFEGLQGRELSVQLNKSDLFSVVGRTASGQPLCRVGVQPSHFQDENVMLLGDVFLRRIVTVHSMANHTVTLYLKPYEGGRDTVLLAEETSGFLLLPLAFAIASVSTCAAAFAAFSRRRTDPGDCYSQL